MFSLQGISDELKARVLDILHSVDAEPGSQEQREQIDRAWQPLEDMKPKKPERPPVERPSLSPPMEALRKRLAVQVQDLRKVFAREKEEAEMPTSAEHQLHGKRYAVVVPALPKPVASDDDPSSKTHAINTPASEKTGEQSGNPRKRIKIASLQEPAGFESYYREKHGQSGTYAESEGQSLSDEKRKKLKQRREVQLRPMKHTIKLMEEVVRARRPDVQHAIRSELELEPPIERHERRKYVKVERDWDKESNYSA